MRKKYILTVLNVLVATAAVVITVSAGSARPPGPPESTYAYSLSDVYNRLNTGKMATKSAFTEPDSAPGTWPGYSFDDLYEIIGERAPVARTGQTMCWDINGNVINCAGTGQDGDYKKGATWPIPRFENNGDGTATDKLTGLVWLRNANCTAFFSGDSTGQNRRDWDEALTAANSLAPGYCGLADGSSAGDWRLPNVRELFSLIDYSRTYPALPNGHPFTDVQMGAWGYWSSSTCVETTNPVEAWSVTIGKTGGGYCQTKSLADCGYVLAVRDGE